MLDDSGYVISKIDVSVVIYGYTQAAFQRYSDDNVDSAGRIIDFDECKLYRIVKTVKVSDWMQLDLGRKWDV